MSDTWNQDLLSIDLNYAVRNSDKEQVRHLLEKGADPNYSGFRPVGEVPSSSAIFYVEDAEIAKMLLDAGADPNAWSYEDDGYQNPLHCVVSSESIRLLLLEHGADIHAQNHDGNTPLHLASGPDEARVLIKYGASIHTENEQGESPLSLLNSSSYYSDDVKAVIREQQALELREEIADALTPTLLYKDEQFPVACEAQQPVKQRRAM